MIVVVEFFAFFFTFLYHFNQLTLCPNVVWTWLGRCNAVDPIRGSVFTCSCLDYLQKTKHPLPLFLHRAYLWYCKEDAAREAEILGHNSTSTFGCHLQSSRGRSTINCFLGADWLHPQEWVKDLYMIDGLLTLLISFNSPSTLCVSHYNLFGFL